MAILFLDGADSYHTIGGPLYGPTAPNIGYTVSQTNAGTMQVTVGAGTNTSSRSIAISRSTIGYSRVSKQLKVTGTRFTIGFAMLAGARDSVMQITDLFEVKWPTTGYPEINGVKGNVIPILNTWYYWEIVVDKTLKTVTVWLNGYQQFSSIFENAVADIIEFSWGWTHVGEPATLFIDDIAVTDNTNPDGKSKTDRLGPIEIATRLPTGSTHTDWAPTPSSKENWKIVSQIPALPNEYVQSNVVDSYDLYTSNTAVLKPVIAVAVAALTAKTDVDDHAVSLLISDTTKTVESAPIDLSTQYTYIQSVFETDAAGAPWTTDSATAVNFGIKVK